jgi:hypothetical protein
LRSPRMPRPPPDLGRPCRGTTPWRPEVPHGTSGDHRHDRPGWSRSRGSAQRDGPEPAKSARPRDPEPDVADASWPWSHRQVRVIGRCGTPVPATSANGPPSVPRARRKCRPTGRCPGQGGIGRCGDDRCSAPWPRRSRSVRSRGRPAPPGPSRVGSARSSGRRSPVRSAGSRLAARVRPRPGSRLEARR